LRESKFGFKICKLSLLYLEGLSCRSSRPALPKSNSCRHLCANKLWNVPTSYHSPNGQSLTQSHIYKLIIVSWNNLCKNLSLDNTVFNKTLRKKIKLSFW
jgi:hypothetical protein